MDARRGALLFDTDVALHVLNTALSGDRVIVLLSAGRENRVVVFGHPGGPKVGEFPAPVNGTVIPFGERILIGAPLNRIPPGNGLVSIEPDGSTRRMFPTLVHHVEVVGAYLVIVARADSDADREAISKLALPDDPAPPARRQSDRAEWVVLLDGATFEARWSAFICWGRRRSLEGDGVRLAVTRGVIVHVEGRGRARHLVGRDDGGGRRWTSSAGFAGFDDLLATATRRRRRSQRARRVPRRRVRREDGRSRRYHQDRLQGDPPAACASRRLATAPGA